MINMNKDICDLQHWTRIEAMNQLRGRGGDGPSPHPIKFCGDKPSPPRSQHGRFTKSAQGRRVLVKVSHFHILRFVAKITILSFAMFALTSCQQNVARASDSIPPAIVQSAGAASPPAGDPAAGRTLFLKNCAHCHGASAHGDEGPDLHKLDESDDWIANRIRKGKPGQMTAFAGKLQPAEINVLIAYLRTLK